ncbi:MAG: GHKL domain-containing protein [Opitutales bacterium]|nr:GHKL domain-containing protein [Opitutales bacterium]
MKSVLRNADEPLRLAFGFMLIALLLPLVVVIWLLLKNVVAERTSVREELMAAYRQQLEALAQERSAEWRNFLARAPGESGSPQAFFEWMQEGDLEAMVLFNDSGELIYPRLKPEAGLPGGLAGGEVLALLRGWVDALSGAPSHEAGASVTSVTVASADLEEVLAAARTDAVVRRWLLRLTELAPSHAIWRPELEVFWKNLFTQLRGVSHLTWRERGFLAHRLLRIEADALSPGFRSLLTRESHRFDQQDQLLRTYFEQNWTSGETLDRWLLMRPNHQVNGDTIYTHVRRDESDVLILQIRESVFAERFIPLWRQASLPDHLWVNVRSLGGTLFGDPGHRPDDAFAIIDLPPPFYGWKVHVGFQDEGFLARTTQQQTLVTLAVGVVLVLLIAVAGILALRQVTRQIHLNKLKNDFIGLVSHELRTPLASMRMLVETLLEGRYRDEETLREYLSMVASENKRLSRLVENFLTFSRMQRGRSQFKMVEVQLDGILQAALAATRPHLESEGVRFTKSIEPDLPTLAGDEDALVTVVINLLENAYKYTTEDKRIHLDVAACGQSVVITVEDNGIGIPARELKQIFKEFYQVDQRLARRSEGSGLGLSINQHIVRAHGGEITVESQEGVGSTFRVRLPTFASRRARGREPETAAVS